MAIWCAPQTHIDALGAALAHRLRGEGYDARYKTGELFGMAARDTSACCAGAHPTPGPKTRYVINAMLNAGDDVRVMNQ